jgi:hypothetical protein
LAGEPPRDVIVRGGEADDAVQVHATCRHQRCCQLELRLRSWRCFYGFASGDGGEFEAADRRDHADALMRSLVVVVLDPRIDGRLRGHEVGEGLAGESFALECLVESFHLPRRGR